MVVHFETVGNLLDAYCGLRLYKPPHIAMLSPSLVPATGRTIISLHSTEVGLSSVTWHISVASL